ncbi:MAG: GIY-YIG nuclease family protein [Thermofilaceae archaeon]
MKSSRLKVELPVVPGVYALVIIVLNEIELKTRRFELRLRPGCYVYIGSARGPGGLAARISRHLKLNKKVRWHIDHLTTKSVAIHYIVFSFNISTECPLTPQLELLGFKHCVKGFGNTDCKARCTSHLLRFDGGIDECVMYVAEAFKQAGFEPHILALGRK